MPLTIKNLSKTFGNKVIFDNFNYSFDETGIYVLVGDSGRGKTTLLRIISGLDKDYVGEVSVDTVSYAFQEYRLFPVLTALENITKILWEHPAQEHVELSRNLLASLGFSDADMLLYPQALSGGMKQRVSLCRAILAKSRILLLDEPFKELDGALHERLRSILAKEAKERLIILTAHNLDALGDLKRTVVPIV